MSINIFFPRKLEAWNPVLAEYLPLGLQTACFGVAFQLGES